MCDYYLLESDDFEEALVGLLDERERIDDENDDDGVDENARAMVRGASPLTSLKLETKKQ